MSAKAMGRVWDLDLPHNKRLVLLAMADHADHDGGSIYPSVDLIAWKTGYEERQVRRIIAALVADGILTIVRRHTERSPTVYQLNLDAGTVKPPFKGGQNVRSKGGQNVHPRVDILSPEGGHLDPPRVDIAMSTEPPWNHHIEPPPPCDDPPTPAARAGGGGGGSEQPTETQRALVAFGFSAKNARRFRDLPLDAVQAELKAAKARGSGPGSLVLAWDICPPTAPKPPEPPANLPPAYYAAPPPPRIKRKPRDEERHVTTNEP